MSEIKPHLIPTITDRGFKHMPVVNGAFDSHDVRVYESSAASDPHIWLRAWDGERVVTVHLPAVAALELGDQLRWLAANHYQLQSKPSRLPVSEGKDTNARAGS